MCSIMHQKGYWLGNLCEEQVELSYVNDPFRALDPIVMKHEPSNQGSIAFLDTYQ